MKFLKYYTVLIVVLFSCKTQQITNNTSTSFKKLTAKQIVKKHLKTKFDAKTIDAKLKVNYANANEELGFSVQLKMKKDEVIYLKGTKLITIFKAKITPEKVSFYSPYKKNYFEGDFSTIKKLLGIDINFWQLQNLLTGQALLDIKGQKNISSISENSYKLEPKIQSELFDIFYLINPGHFKLNKQKIITPTKNQRLDIEYSKYITKKNQLFPEKILIKAKSKDKLSEIDMNVKLVEFNKKLHIPFKIPSSYKEIQF